MGSEKVSQIIRFNNLQYNLGLNGLPRIPFLPIKDDSKVTNTNFENPFDLNKANNSVPVEEQYFPISFSFTPDGQKWLFPYEPMINISGGNNIIKRNVAKQGNKLIGTIKERWSQKDFEISITGVLIGSLTNGSPEDCFPREQMTKLFEFLTKAKVIYVYCHTLEILGINRIVIEDYNFPFTKGENIQAYDIKALSDYSHNLLIKVS